MSYRVSAIQVIARRRVLETLINPGYYIALALGLILGYVLTAQFVRSVDSGGPTFLVNVLGTASAQTVRQALSASAISPLYELISKTLVGAFGGTYVTQLFSEGPFLFAIIVAFLPPFLFLALSTVFRFGLEKNVGALELIVYGPVDGTAYFLAFLVKDLLLTVLTLGCLLLFFWINALVANLVLGPLFFFAVLQLLFFALMLFCYGILTSVVAENAASSIALFLGILAFFVIIHVGSFAIVGGALQSVTQVISQVLKWISPLFFWNLATRASGSGNVLLFVGSLLLFLAVSLAILFGSHLVLKAKGVRS